MLPVVPRHRAQPGRLRIGKRSLPVLPVQHVDASFFRTSAAIAHFHAAEVIHPGAAKVAFDLPSCTGVMSEEEKRRLGQANQGFEIIAAGIGEDGVARSLVSQQHVELLSQQLGGTARLETGRRRRLAAGVGGFVVDPPQGGNATLLRDGGISSPGNPAYVYNSTGAASYTGRIQQLVAEVNAAQSFNPSVGLTANASLSDYANASVSWLNAANQNASDGASYQNALAS